MNDIEQILNYVYTFIGMYKRLPKQTDMVKIIMVVEGNIKSANEMLYDLSYNQLLIFDMYGYKLSTKAYDMLFKERSII